MIVDRRGVTTRPRGPVTAADYTEQPGKTKRSSKLPSRPTKRSWTVRGRGGGSGEVAGGGARTSREEGGGARGGGLAV